LALLPEPLQMLRASAGELLIEAMMTVATRTPRDGKLTFMVSLQKNTLQKWAGRKVASLVHRSTRITDRSKNIQLSGFDAQPRIWT
jgi:hypothetical protein